jgi:hypothetical protein
MSEKRLNIIVRGHVRSSFDDGRLKDLVGNFSEMFDLSIYAQTWDIFQNSLSWREMEAIDKKVTEEGVRDYFGDIEIKSLSIIDDSSIRHFGNTEGTIGRTPCPVLAWKNMYYGMMEASSRVVAAEDPKSITLQMRFDMLSNRFSPSMEEMVEFVKREYSELDSKDEVEERIRFMRMKTFLGVDNAFMARAADMHKFICYMYYDMDRILNFHRRSFHQEHIAFHERKSFLKWESPSGAMFLT